MNPLCACHCGIPISDNAVRRRLRFRKGHHIRTKHKNVACADYPAAVRDLYWAAGFLEGEGCFRRTGIRGKYKGSEDVFVAQVNFEPVKRILAIFGGSIRLNKPAQSGRKPWWQWRVNGGRARGAMMTMYPLMSKNRREQIRAALLCVREG